ncbi:MAG: hypothetical protein NZL99_01255, partial [Burkholderiaceae bacterium]|nr:hypothetical protein [Burkholderiaceae bacterium]
MRPWLWLAAIPAAPDDRWSSDAHAALTASERARLGRLARGQRRAQFLAGHWLLRLLLAARSAVAAMSVAIESTANGVAVASPAGWRASVSHSGRWVAAAVDCDVAPLGVDIEMMRGPRDIEAIVAAACGRQPTSRTQAYLLWAQHEAQFKCGVAAARCWHAVWGELALACAGRAAPQVS